MSTKSRKRATGNPAKSRRNLANRELAFKKEGSEYAKVIESLGGNMLRVLGFDGKERLCQIRGTMRRREWVNKSDIVLVNLRDYQDTKCDLLLKYSQEEVQKLASYGEIPEQGDIEEVAGPLVLFTETTTPSELLI